MWNRLHLLAALALAGCGAAPSASGPAPGPAPVAQAPGKKLPSIAVRGLDLRPRRLDEAVRGRVALVSLWATWCDACAREFEALNRLDAKVRERGAVVLGVAVGEPIATVTAFAARHRLSYPQLVDESFALADALGEKRVPATLVIDASGRVVFVGGALDEAALDAFRDAMNEHEDKSK